MIKTCAMLASLLVLLGAAVAGCTTAQPTATPAAMETPTTMTEAPTEPPTATATTEAPTATAATEPPTATATAEASTATATTEAATATTTVGAPTATLVPATDTPAPTPTEAPAWAADGVIGADEYPHSTEAAGVRLYWANDAEYLYGAVTAETTGWVAVGLDPEAQMQGANYIVGYVQGGQTTIADMYGTQPTVAHPVDEELGGTDDVVTYGGKEEGGRTTIEFQIPLDSGDAYDRVLVAGESYPVLLAMGSADGLLEYHAARGGSEITLD